VGRRRLADARFARRTGVESIIAFNESRRLPAALERRCDRVGQVRTISHSERCGIRLAIGGRVCIGHAFTSRATMSSTRATSRRLSRLRSRRIMGMKAIGPIRIVAWACLLTGIALVAWQADSGRGSDWLFNVGAAAIVTGSELRVYGESGHGNRRAEVRR
jgi:hypothetical protein